MGVMRAIAWDCPHYFLRRPSSVCCFYGLFHNTMAAVSILNADLLPWFTKDRG